MLRHYAEGGEVPFEDEEDGPSPYDDPITIKHLEPGFNRQFHEGGIHLLRIPMMPAGFGARGAAPYRAPPSKPALPLVGEMPARPPGAMPSRAGAAEKIPLQEGYETRVDQKPEPAAAVAAGPEATPYPADRVGPGGGGGAEGLQQAHEKARLQALAAAGDERPLVGLPVSLAPIGGATHFVPGPSHVARVVAHDYMNGAGLPYNPPKTYAKVDPTRAKRIAQAFDEMKHDPDNPLVQASYNALIKETLAQWNAIKKTGLQVDFIRPDMPNPYEASPRLAIKDVRDNNHMWVYPTASGFGSGPEAELAKAGNPMLRDTGEVINGHPAVANDIFRIVHDYFGHYKEGVGFRADGEENAWRSHSAMYSPLARPAMTAETRGQNSWVNYGPHGDTNRTATADTVYAPQKIGIMPPWTHTEGAGDEPGGFGDPGAPYRATPPEAISAAALKYGDEIYTGFNHLDAAHKIPDYKNNKIDFSKISEGFVTNTGRYVDRKEAARIANAADQTSGEKPNLMAEHVYRRYAPTDQGEGLDEPAAPAYRAPLEGDVIPPSKGHPFMVPQGRMSTKSGADTPVVNIDALRAASIGRNADLFKKNVSVVRRYANMPASLARANPEAVLKAYTEHGVSNLLYLHDKMKNEMPEGVYTGSTNWYPGVRKTIDELSERYNLPDYAVAGAIANLSPQRDWNMNRSLGHRVIDTMVNHGDTKFDDAMKEQFAVRAAKSGSTAPLWQQAYTDLSNAKTLAGIDKLDISDGEKAIAKAVFVRLHDEVHRSPNYEIVNPDGSLAGHATQENGEPDPRTWGSLQQIASAVKSVEAAGHPERMSELVGDANKVRNFYNNMLDPFSPNGDVTMDTHAVAAINMRPLSGNSFEVHHNFGSTPSLVDRQKQMLVNGGYKWEPVGGSGMSGVHGLYPVNADIYRQAAAARGILPREMQSVTWEGVKGLFPPNMKGNKGKGLQEAVRNVWKEFRNGQITQQQAQERIYDAVGGITPPDWFTAGWRPQRRLPRR